MKLLIVTCLKENLADVSGIFKQAEIDVFSTNKITGHHTGNQSNLLEDWFASGDEQVDSLMIFAFTSDSNAERGLELISNYNKKLKENFPVRTFVVSIEKSLNN